MKISKEALEFMVEENDKNRKLYGRDKVIVIKTLQEDPYIIFGFLDKSQHYHRCNARIKETQIILDSAQNEKIKEMIIGLNQKMLYLMLTDSDSKELIDVIVY